MGLEHRQHLLGGRHVFATALAAGMTVEQVADLDLSYAPPFAPVWDPALQSANKAVWDRRKR